MNVRKTIKNPEIFSYLVEMNKAADIEKLIVSKSNLLNSNLSTISSALASGNISPNFCLELGRDAWLPFNLSSIFEKIEKYPTGFTLNLTACVHYHAAIHNIFKNMQTTWPEKLSILLPQDKAVFYNQSLAAALSEGRAPKGFQCRLHLEENEIIYIARALTSGKCPEDLELDLSSNNLTDDSALAIIAALEENKFPKGLVLNLTDNLIEKDLLQKIDGIIQAKALLEHSPVLEEKDKAIKISRSSSASNLFVSKTEGTKVVKEEKATESLKV